LRTSIIIPFALPLLLWLKSCSLL